MGHGAQEARHPGRITGRDVNEVATVFVPCVGNGGVECDCSGPGLSEQADPPDHRHGRRRPDGRCRARHGRKPGQVARPAPGHREPLRLRRQYRRRGGRQSRAGRLHARPHPDRQRRHQSVRLSRHDVRSVHRSRAGRAADKLRHSRRRQRQGAGQRSARAHRARQARAWQAVLWIVGQRHRAASRRRDVQGGGRRGHPARAVSWRRARGERHGRRPCPAHLRRPGRGARPGRGRSFENPGGRAIRSGSSRLRSIRRRPRPACPDTSS